MYLWMSMQRTELAVNQKISHKISGHRDEEYLSDFSARKKIFFEYHSRFLFAFISLHHLLYHNVSMQHESMPHFLRLKLLMIFMGSLLSRHRAWARPPWCRDCEQPSEGEPCRQEGSTKWLLSRYCVEKSIHAWHWTNLFTPPLS